MRKSRKVDWAESEVEGCEKGPGRGEDQKVYLGGRDVIVAVGQVVEPVGDCRTRGN